MKINKRPPPFYLAPESNTVTDNFENYFTLLSGANTRNKNCLLKLPVIKKEYFRGSFIYMGAKLYNEMNIDIRKTLNFRKFKTYVKNFYN